MRPRGSVAVTSFGWAARIAFTLSTSQLLAASNSAVLVGSLAIAITPLDLRTAGLKLKWSTFGRQMLQIPCTIIREPTKIPTNWPGLMPHGAEPGGLSPLVVGSSDS